jgi:hypothetical protein
MPAVKTYTRVNFQNYPSTSTPLNATNLNKLDKGIDDLDDEVVTVKNAIENMSFDADSISYDNTSSGLQATDVQDAVDEINDNLTALDTALKNWHISQAYTGNNNITLSKSKDEYSFIGAMISTDTGSSDNGEVLQQITVIPTSIFTSYTFKTLRVEAGISGASVQMIYVDDTHIKMDVDSGKKGRYILID